MAGMRTTSRRAGQGLLEYVVLVAAVGLLLVGAVQALRGSMGKAYGKVAERLEGVGHTIDGRLDAPAPASSEAPSSATSPSPIRAVALGAPSTSLHEHAGPHAFERQIVLDAASGRYVGAEVCALCGAVR